MNATEKRLVALHCFAVPGVTMVDEINPATGRSVIYGKTLEDVRRHYPDAQVMTIDGYCQSKAAAQDTPIVWLNSTEERYNEMLECLPPAAMNSHGFLVGEPMDHHATTGRPRYTAFIQWTTSGEGWSETSYFELSRPITKVEFVALTAAMNERKAGA